MKKLMMMMKMIIIIGRAKRTPTLGYSIEISRDILYIYICRFVCPYVTMCRRPKHAHAQSQFWAVKTDM